MPFRYPLQSLLRLREGLERQEENSLFAIAAHVAALRAQIEQLRENQMQSRRAEFQQMQTGSVGAALQFGSTCEEAARVACKKLEAELADAERRRRVQLTAYQAARQKREILESLRERRETVYEIEVAHREQQTLDDTFLLQTYPNNVE
jgi:flagellar export protein FliJ